MIHTLLHGTEAYRYGEHQPYFIPDVLETQAKIHELARDFPPFDSNRDRAIFHDLSPKGKDRTAWYGMPKDELIKLPTAGWPQGATAAVNALPHVSLDVITDGRRIQSWSDDDGETVDFDRLCAGLPYWRAQKHIPGHGRGGRIVPLLIDLEAVNFVHADAVLWRTYCALQATDALEAAGYRVQITSVVFCKDIWPDNMYHGARHNLLLTTIKQPEDHLYMNSLAAALSPAFFRRFCFQYWESLEPRPASCMGYPQRWVPDDRWQNFLHIHGNILTEASAREWLEGLDYYLNPGAVA